MKESLSYIASALEPESWPRVLTPQGMPVPEIALAGRSNVGKSSLINLLANQKNLAKVSATPGKTQRLQFFQYEERCLLVDLPGYGYAKAPPHLRAEWSQAIDVYLNTRPSLKLLVILIDIRRDPSDDDIRLVLWAQKKNLPFLIIFTKTDTLKERELEMRKKELFKLIPCEAILAPTSRAKIWPHLLRYVE